MAESHGGAAIVIELNLGRLDGNLYLARFGYARFALGFPSGAGFALGRAKVRRIGAEVPGNIVIRPRFCLGVDRRQHLIRIRGARRLGGCRLDYAGRQGG